MDPRRESSRVLGIFKGFQCYKRTQAQECRLRQYVAYKRESKNRRFRTELSLHLNPVFIMLFGVIVRKLVFVVYLVMLIILYYFLFLIRHVTYFVLLFIYQRRL